MKADYITGGSALPPSLAFPRFLLGMELRTTTKEIYAILLDMAMNGEGSVDSRGRRYLAFINPDIAAMIDRTTGTVSQSLAELEHAGLIKRRLVKRNAPYRTYVMLPAGEDAP